MSRTLVLFLVLSAATGASAQPARPGARPGAAPRAPRPAAARPAAAGREGVAASQPAPTLADLDEIIPQLSSPEPDKVREAIDLLSVIDRPEVVAPIAALLRSGQPDAITDRALEALAGLAHRSTVEVLTEFTRHRRPGARRRAYKGLEAVAHPSVVPILERGLSDSDRSVRATAALALGALGARGSLDLLFRAFERGVPEAAVAIGKLGDARTLARFHDYLGRQPLSVMLTGYHEYLSRQDIPKEAKTDIVAKLGEVSGPMVRTFLEQFLASFSERDVSPLKRQVEQTIRRIPPAGTPSPAGGTGAPPAPAPGSDATGAP